MRHLLYTLFCCFILTFSISTAQWQNGQDASFVLGKPDFITNTTSTTDNKNMSLPAGVAIDFKNNKLYIVDEANNRVLRFAYPVTSNNPGAELVFGQTDFQSKDYNANKANPTANTLNQPTSVAVYNGTLWIGDRSNFRILRFDNAHLHNTNAPEADGVLGQKNFNENIYKPVGQSNFGSFSNNTINLAIDSSGNLFVADGSNSRVLRFDNASAKANGANADGVLGQHTFINSGFAINEWGMRFPRGLAIDKNGSLFVADHENSRVLRFDNAANKEDGANADGVLGQVDFDTRTTHTDQSGTYYPIGLAVDGDGRLYVAEYMRVMIFNNAAGKSNGANADFVLGYSDFVSGGFKGVTAGTFNGIEGIAIDNAGHLFVADRANSRVLQFTSQGPLPVEERNDQLSLEINLSPNPAQDELLLKCTLLSEENVTVEFYSLVGERILKTVQNFEGKSGENTVNIPLKELPSGSYSLRISTRDTVLTKQFSIVR